MRYITIFYLLSFTSYGQGNQEVNHKIDSLKSVIKQAKNDSVIVKTWFEWDNLIYDTDPDLDLELNKKIDSLSQKNLQGQLNVNEKAFFTKSSAKAKINLGYIYDDRGDIATAIKYLTEALKLSEKSGNKKNQASALNMIAGICKDQGDDESALNNYKQSQQIYEELEDLSGLAGVLNNIGIIYEDRGQTELALDYYKDGLETFKQTDNLVGMSNVLGSLGNIYSSMGEKEKAKEYYTEAIEIKKEIGDRRGVIICQVNIAGVYNDINDYAQAVKYGEEGLKGAEEIESAFIASYANSALWEIYKKGREYKKALEVYERYIVLKDSLASEDNQREVLNQQYKYEYEKQAVADSIKSAEAAKVKDALLSAEKAENKQRKQQTYFLYVGLGLTALFGVFIFNRFRITRKQKDTIQTQKKQVDAAFLQLEEKNQEILDSINYARRIQAAILPSQQIVKTHLPNSFVLYKPKDIVAGDFFWLEHQNDKVLFAAADCTGHGVPGAMVSVVCNNALNRSVREHNLLEPGAILDMTRHIVIGEFAKNEEDVKDGMDLALCSLDGTTLKYAGANNPLWIIRKGAKVIEEIKANKQPIGKFDHAVPYTTHTVELEKGDSIYIFSDGYVDQFGGERGKKFKGRAFRELLLSLQDKTMEEQNKHIDDAFEKWRGDLEQIDDVCVIGVRV